MKVDISNVRKAGTKAGVPVVRVKRRGYRVNIPVRVVVQDEIEAAPCGFAVEPDTDAKQVSVAEEASAVEETERAPDVNAEEDDAVDMPAESETKDEQPAEDPDEAELLALIAEEEAEMVSQLSQNGNADVYQGSFDTDRIGSALEDVSAQDILEQADEAIAEADEDLAEAIESLAELDNESAQVTDELTPDEIALLEDEAAAVAGETEQHGSVEQYMRYFDRGISGEKIEVSDSGADGQEIICVDGESGRLSRVCGIIRHNQPAQPVDETSATADEE